MKFQEIRNATAIITYANTKFLLDPFLAPRGSYPPVPSPYNNTPNPMVDLPLPIEEIIKVEATIVTHMHHFDHFDEFAARNLPKNMPMFVQSDKENKDMRALGFTDVTTLTAEGVKFGAVTLYRTAALHGDGVAAAYYYKRYEIPGDACGVVMKAPGEKTLYLAGDTLWYDGIETHLDVFRPEVIVLNAANAQMYDGAPILMGQDGLMEVANFAPQAKIVCSHLDAVNHTRVSREDLRKFTKENKLEDRVLIPLDGETLAF